MEIKFQASHIENYTVQGDRAWEWINYSFSRATHLFHSFLPFSWPGNAEDIKRPV